MEVAVEDPQDPVETKSGQRVSDSTQGVRGSAVQKTITGILQSLPYGSSSALLPETL